jgi:hypothetical protein
VRAEKAEKAERTEKTEKRRGQRRRRRGVILSAAKDLSNRSRENATQP